MDTRDESSLPVKQFQYTDWPEESVPASGSGLIDLIGQVQKWQTRSGDRPIVVHCRYIICCTRCCSDVLYCTIILTIVCSAHAVVVVVALGPT